MRLFVALPVPDEVKKEIGLLQGDISRVCGDGIRWVDPGNIHITLSFLGETEEKAVDGISAAMLKAVENERHFVMQTDKAGVFPSIRNPRILWLGVSGAEPLSRIKHALDEGLQDIGVRPDRKNFFPHLTLARVRAPVDGRKAAKYLNDKEMQSMPINVRCIQLIESRLRPSGPTYRLLSAAAIGETKIR